MTLLITINVVKSSVTLLSNYAVEWLYQPVIELGTAM